VVENPAVDVAAAIADLFARGRALAVVRDAIGALPGPMIERFGILTQASLDERGITERDRDEDVEPRPALDEQSGNVRSLAHEILRRRRLVIDVSSVDVSAAFDEIPRELQCSSVMQWGLSIAAASMHE
jgi:hypothetical protein